MIREDDLIQCVLESLQARVQSVVSMDEVVNSISTEQANQELIAGFKAQIADNQMQLEQARQFKSTLYENFVSGVIEKEDYQDLKKRYTERVEQAQEAIDQLREEMERASNNSSDRLRWMQHFKQFSTMKELDRRAVITTIQSICITSKKSVDITYRYHPEYEQARRMQAAGKGAV